VHLARGDEFFGDLEARVAAADHEHPSGWEAVGIAVRRAVKLDDVWAQAAGDGGNGRDLEGAGGDDHLVGFI